MTIRSLRAAGERTPKAPMRAVSEPSAPAAARLLQFANSRSRSFLLAETVVPGIPAGFVWDHAPAAQRGPQHPVAGPGRMAYIDHRSIDRDTELLEGQGIEALGGTDGTGA